MLISEEYLKRNNLLCPIIKRPRETYNLIVELTEGSSINQFAEEMEFTSISRSDLPWLFLSITGYSEPHSPTSYRFSWACAGRDNYKNNGALVDAAADSIVVKWDEYDQYVLRLAGSQHVNIVDGMIKIRLIAWHAFLYCADNILKNVPMDMQRDILTSIDDGLPVDTRMQAQDKLLKHWISNDAYAYRTWENVYRYAHPTYYAHWLVDLFGKVHDNPVLAKDYKSYLNVA